MSRRGNSHGLFHYFHINPAALASHGNRFVSAYHTWTIYKFKPPRVAALRRSSLEIVDPARAQPDARSPGPRTPGRATARSPPARRTTSNAPTTAPGSQTASRQPRGTTGHQPPATPPPRQPRPRSTDHERLPPRTAADPLAGQPEAAQATTSLPAPPDPTCACALPSQVLSVERCDDHLNPPWVPWSGWWISPRSGRRR
jgi:hypothetical protein